MSTGLARLLTTETLPAVAGSTKAVVVADFEGAGALALRNVSLQRASTEDLRLAREKADAVLLYRALRAEGLSRGEAAGRVYSAHVDRFPLLQCAGHGGGNLLAPPKGERNLRQWEGQLKDAQGVVRAENVTALVRDYAKGRRDRKGHPTFWKFVGAWYLKRQGPDLAEAYRLALADARKRGIDDAELPTLKQVRYWYQTNVDQASIDLARNGETFFGEHYQYFIDRDWDGVLVNDIWFSDHHELDCPIRTEDGQGGWRPARVFLTAVMDAKSFYMVGWQISLKSGNNGTIANSVALGMITAGFHGPRYLYCDNGADYRAKGWDQPVECGGTEHSVMRQLSIDVINSLPYRAQAKTIERRFKEVCSWFSKLWPGYLGNTPGSRSEQGQYFWDNPEHLPTMYELSVEFARWLTETYHQRPSAGKILQGKTPQEAWDARIETRAPWTKEALYEAFLMPADTRKVGRGPSVQINNRIYYAQELRQFQGRDGDAGKILVKLDRYEPEHIFCYHLDGRKVCEARTKGRISALALSDEERAKIGEAERHKRHQLREAYTVIAAETGGTYKLADPVERIAMIVAPDAYTIETVGKRRSVKGGSHMFVHRRLAPAAGAEPAGPALPAAADDAQMQDASALEFRQTRADAEMARISEFQLAIMADAGAGDNDDDKGPVDFAAALTRSEEEEDDGWLPEFQ